MSHLNVQSKNRGLTNSLSLSVRRSTEPNLITTPNLLDLQLNLPDPINRPTFSLVRGVKVPNSHPPPNFVYHYPPQPLPKTQHPPKPQVTHSIQYYTFFFYIKNPNSNFSSLSIKKLVRQIGTIYEIYFTRLASV